MLYTPKGSSSIKFNMCIKKDVEVIRNLIKNPSRGTTWRVLRCDMVQENKTQKPGRSNAPGFRTASDDDSSANAGSVKVDKTTKDHGKKVAARGKVNAGKAASKESTTNASSTKRRQTLLRRLLQTRIRRLLKQALQTPKSLTTFLLQRLFQRNLQVQEKVRLLRHKEMTVTMIPLI